MDVSVRGSEPMDLCVKASIAHERLEHEVIAIDLETGAYYSFEDVAADCWTIAVRGAGIDEIVTVVAERYDVTPERARADIAQFLDDLEQHGVLQRGEGAQARVGGGQLPAIDGKRPYDPPVVEKFDDLEELILLDPIHEVDPAGWPTRRAP